MKLIVADAELDQQTAYEMEEVEALIGLGNQFVSRVEKLMKLGYVSEAVSAALAERCNVVTTALVQLQIATQPLSSTVSAFVNAIDDIDHL